MQWAIHLGQSGRNDGAFYLSCQLRDNGYSLSEVLELYETYEANIPSTDTKGKRSAFTQREYAQAIRSAFSKPRRQPWSFDPTK